MKKTNRIFFIVLFLLPLAASAQSWRVAAKVYKDNYNASDKSYYRSDSTRYSYDYGSNRGSSYNNDTIKSNHVVTYTRRTGYSYAILWERFLQYGTDDNVSSSSYHAYNSIDQLWTLISYDSSIYTASGKLQIRSAYGLKPAPTPVGYSYFKTSQQEYVYDTADRVTFFYDRSSAASPLSPNAGYHLIGYNAYIYDSLGRLVLDSQRKEHPMVPTLFVFGDQKSYEYDMSGNVVKYTRYRIDTPANFINEVRYYIYDANNVLVMDSNATQLNGVPVNKEVHYYTYTANGRIATDSLKVYNHSSGSLLRTEVRMQTYTGFDRIDENVIQLYDSSGAFLNGEYNKYYYEAYWPVSTPTVAKGQNDLLVYPVPSSNFINLKWTVDKPTTINARIVNLQGQVMKQWNDKADGSYSKSIHVGELPAGNYIVVLDTGKEQVSKAIVINK